MKYPVNRLPTRTDYPGQIPGAWWNGGHDDTENPLERERGGDLRCRRQDGNIKPV